MGNRLKDLRNRKGWTLDEAAERFGLSRGGYIKLERSERRLNSDYIAKAASVFGVPQSDVIAPDGVPVVGLAGGGPGGAVLFGFGDGELGEAPVPPGVTEDTVALEVRGNSMRGIAYHGWYIYYDDRRSPLTEDMLGEPCVLGLPDGRVVVKVPFQGRTAGRFDLESANPAYDTMRDQPVEWAALVIAIVPRRTAERRHPPPGGEAAA